MVFVGLILLGLAVWKQIETGRNNASIKTADFESDQTVVELRLDELAEQDKEKVLSDFNELVEQMESGNWQSVEGAGYPLEKVE